MSSELQSTLTPNTKASQAVAIIAGTPHTQSHDRTRTRAHTRLIVSLSLRRQTVRTTCCRWSTTCSTWRASGRISWSSRTSRSRSSARRTRSSTCCALTQVTFVETPQQPHTHHTHDRRPTVSLWPVCTAKKQVEVTAVVDVARPQRVGDPVRYGRYRLPLLLLGHHLTDRGDF
jgi:hypothetical protein